MGLFFFILFYFYFFSFSLINKLNNRCESIEGLKNEVIVELKSYCVSECNDQCKQIIEKYQEMECFEELKDSIGDLLTNSLKLCCESNKILCKSSNGNPGLVAGVVVGILVGIIVGISVVVLWKKFKNRRLKIESDFQIQMK